MPNNTGKNNLTIWITVGVIAAVAIVYFAMKGGVPGVGNLGGGGAKPGEKPEGVIATGTAPVAPGASVVTTEGEVLSAQGNVAKNDVTPGAPEAPQQSAPITPETLKELPKEAIKLTVSPSGFKPADFSVDAGSVVTLSVTSDEAQTHVFKFEDPSLSAVAVGIGPSETRAITFNAPEKKGDYIFFCDVPGHRGRGETGKMTVK